MGTLGMGKKKRKSFDEQGYSEEGAAGMRSLEENTGATEEWKPQPGSQTKEVGGWGGTGYRYETDPRTGQPVAVPGSRLSDQDVDRYRSLGAEQRGAVQLDQRTADGARGLQMGSLAGLQSAARGQAPSRAASLGQLATQSAVQGAAGAQVGRGAGGSLRATRGAIGGLAQQTGQAALQAGDMRAQEMTRSRGEYFGGAAGVRKQDIGAATTDAQLEAANRDMQEKRRQQYEKLAWDTRNAEMFGMVEQRGQEDQAWIDDQRAKAAESEQERRVFTDTAGAGVGMITGGMSSDMRTKNLITHGSLVGLNRRK